jgi:hypothetical protein
VTLAGDDLPDGVAKLTDTTYRVDYGTTVTVQADANELHHVANWVNEDSVAYPAADIVYDSFFTTQPEPLFPAYSALTLTLTGDTTTEAIFGLNYRHLTFSHNEGGYMEFMVEQDSMSFTFRDGVMADLHCSARCATDKRGVVSGTDGYIVVGNINNPCSIKVFSKSGELTQELDCRAPISGFEYEFLACRKAIAEGRIEPEEMPHSEILRVMSIMDGLRKEWGVRFPMD